jgi:hypothetical protein
MMIPFCRGAFERMPKRTELKLLKLLKLLTIRFDFRSIVELERGLATRAGRVEVFLIVVAFAVCDV